MSSHMCFRVSSPPGRSDWPIRENNIDVSLEEALALDKEICKKLQEERGNTPVPGAIDLIKELASKNIKLASASSSTFEQIENIVKDFQLESYFTCLASGAALNRPKPAPDVFLQALKLLDAKPEETIIIEDSKNGTLAAKAACVACVGFQNPHSGNQDLYAANVVTDSLTTLNSTYLNQVLCRANKVPVTMGETKRLILRELSMEDIPCLYKFYEKEEFSRYLPSISSLEEELEKHKAYIENVYSFYNYGLWGVFDKKNNKLIGQAGIQNKCIDGQNELELSYLINSDAWNLGYATEACRKIIQFAISELDASRLVAVIAKENTASCQVAKKLGMSAEKELVYHNFESILYSIDLQEERKKYLACEQTVQSVKPDTSVYSKRYV